MALSPEQIAGRRFVVALRGYDRDEVDSFLKEVSVQVNELLHGAGPDVVVPAPDPFQRLGEQIESILRAAVQASEEIRLLARQEASEVMAAALLEAEAVRRALDDRVARAEAIETRAAEMLRLAEEAREHADASQGTSEAEAEAGERPAATPDEGQDPSDRSGIGEPMTEPAAGRANGSDPPPAAPG